jgi:nucleotide-binding universal stress UspA family protein
MYYHPNVPTGTGEICRVVVQPSAKRFAGVRKVLIPIDGSRHALQAITHLIGSANVSSVTEVHLVNVQPLVMQGDFTLNVAVGAERRARLAAAREVLDRAQAHLDDTGIRCERSILFGDPAEMIARYARDNGCHAILMGTRGLGSLQGLLRGSVATKVVSLADVPVTLVKEASGQSLFGPAADREDCSSARSESANQLSNRRKA